MLMLSIDKNDRDYYLDFYENELMKINNQYGGYSV